MDPDTGTGSTSAPKPEDNVQVSKAAPATDYQRSLQIVLITVFGVFGILAILIVGTLIYRCLKKRQRQGADRIPSIQRSVSVDLEHKQVPSVLLLYSNDCSAHEKVVESLAGFLIETCNCNVHLDVFEEQIIHERGLDEWLVDKLQEVEFIIVLSSIGARLRCSKKKVRFKVDPCRTLPDYFAVAVDYVAEKMRVERAKGMPLTTFCVVYMDYSTENDIPPQLEMGYKFCLMKDITTLFCHLHGLDGHPTKNGEPIEGLSEETFDRTELGQELKIAIESAKEYFRSNPDWVEDRMEPTANPGKFKSRHTRKSSLEPLLAPDIKENLQPTEDRNRMDSDRIHCQTLPKMHPNIQQMPLVSLQNRQNSFPSSLSSRQTISTPPLQKNSKSCDNFHSETASLCELCGMEGHSSGSNECKATRYLSPQECENEDGGRSKSKSMPAVFRNSLHSSQTIFVAEVHKEWDYHDGHISQADSQETSSITDSIVDDLERDLDSIVNPKHIPAVTYAHSSYDNLSHVFSNLPLSFSSKGENFVLKSTNTDHGQSIEVYNETSQHYEDAKSSLADTDSVHVDLQHDIQLMELKL